MNLKGNTLFAVKLHQSYFDPLWDNCCFKSFATFNKIFFYLKSRLYFRRNFRFRQKIAENSRFLPEKSFPWNYIFLEEILQRGAKAHFS